MKVPDVRMFKFETNMLGIRCNPLLLLLCLFIGSLVGTFVFCSCAKFSFLETFQSIGSDINYNIGDGIKDSYTNKRLEQVTVKNDDSKSSIMPGEILDRSMNIFSETKFSHSCCPSAYSTSGGCACNVGSIEDFINKRGNNRTSCSEY